MKRCLAGGVFLLVCGLLASVQAAPKAPPAAAPATLDGDKLGPGIFTGTVVNAPDGDRMFTLNVVYQKIQLKPGQNLGRTNQQLQRQYNHIMQLQNQMMRPPSRHHNPMHTMQQLQNAMVQFQVQAARAEANLFQVVNATQKVDFQAEEAIKVRIKDLPEQFDDKGNIKKYSREELVELKGKDKKLPGYESTIDNLKVGQIVQVTLGIHKKPKAPPATPPTSSAADKDKDADKDADKDKDKSSGSLKDKDKDMESSVQHKMQVRMVVILKDSDAPQTSPTRPRNKKKNK